jgi:Icc-related predicted phosphoesterase
MIVRTLSLSDVKRSLVYGSQIRTQFSSVDLVIGCGDLPYYYLEYVISMLDVPLLFVRGNHDKKIESTEVGHCSAPAGAIDLHLHALSVNGLLFAGVEGSLKYSRGPFQYSQSDMWFHVLQLVPAMIINKARYGRYLDVFVTHAPPKGIHDKPDLPHQGIDAFRWLLQLFKPAYHFHGHIHIYRPDEKTETRFERTRVINTFGFKMTEIESKERDPKTVGNLEGKQN